MAAPLTFGSPPQVEEFKRPQAGLESMPSLESILSPLPASGAHASFRGYVPGGVSGPGLPTPEELRARLRPGAAPAGESFFVDSMLHAAVPGLIGIEPDRNVAKWREENPWGNFLSQVLGTLPTFVIGQGLGAAALRGAAAAGAVGSTSKLAKAASAMQGIESPFMRGLALETAELAPLQAARLAGSAAFGDFGNTLGQVGLETAGAGALRGGLSSLRNRFSTGANVENRAALEAYEGKLRTVSATENIDVNAPPQTVWSSLKGVVDNTEADPNALRAAADAMPEATEKIYSELPTTKLHLRALVSGGYAAAKKIDQLFRQGKWFDGKKLTIAVDGFKTWEGALQARKLWNGIAPEGWQAHTQFVRQVDIKDPSKMMDYLNDAFRQVDDNTWMVDEAHDGFSVMFKRAITPFDKERPARWYVYKTTKPGEYAPDASGLIERNADLFVREQGWKVADDSLLKKGRAPFLGSMVKMMELLDPAMQTLKFAEDPAAATAFLKKILPDSAAPGIDAARKELGEFGLKLKGGFAPKIAEFARNPRAMAMSALVDQAFEKAELRFLEQAFGAQIASAVRETPAHMLWSGTSTRVGGMIPLTRETWEKGGEVGHAQMREIFLENLSPYTAQDRGMLPEVVHWARQVNRLDMKNQRELLDTWASLGVDQQLDPMLNHYGMTRSWRGSFRMPIYSEDEKLILGYGSGNTAREAISEAKAIAQELNKTAGPGAKLAELPDEVAVNRVKNASVMRAEAQGDDAIELLDHEIDFKIFARELAHGDPRVQGVLNARAKILNEAPVRARKRSGFLGFKGGPGVKPLDLKEMEQMIFSNLRDNNRLLARDSMYELLKPQFMRLAAEDPLLAKRFAARMNAQSGIRGPYSQAIEKGVDDLLGRYFGANVASNAVQKLNAANYWLTLGALDMGFPIINALTPIQTVMPEIAYVVGKTPKAELQKYYSSGLVAMKDGAGVRPVSFLDPVRLMREGTKDMLRPDKDTMAALTRAVDEGIIAPRFIEEVVGTDSRLAQRLFTTGTLTQPGESAFKNFLNVINTPVAMSEEFSRSFSFLIGRRVGKEFWGLSDEGAFEFARQFTRRTNFAYTSAHRPRVLTGALGTGWGLFKNWSFHYLANLSNYSGQAMKGNFWPLAWTMLGTGAVGGAVGIPGYGVANKLVELMSDESISQHLYDLVNEDGESSTLGVDSLLYGWPSLLGFSLQSRAAAPSSQIMRDIQMFGMSATADRAIAAGQWLGTAASAASHGDNPFKSDTANRAFTRAFMPRTAIRALSAWQGEGIRSSRTGNVVVSDPGTLRKVAYTFGITPLHVEKTWDASNVMFDNRAARREAVQYFGAKAAEHWDDPKALQRVAWQAVAAGADASSVLRSAQSRLQKQLGPTIERDFDSVRDRAILRSRGLE